MSHPLFHQIHPEYLQQIHPIPIYGGLMSVMLENTERAEEEGFLLLRNVPSRDDWEVPFEGQQGEIFIKTSDFPTLEQLAEDVRQKRAKRTKEQRARETKRQQRRLDKQKKLLTLAEKKWGTLTEDEFLLFANYCGESNLSALTIPKFTPVLQSHKAFRALLAKNRIPPFDGCHCPWCQKEWLYRKAERKRELSRLREELYGFIDIESFAQDVLGELYKLAKTHKLNEYLRAAVQEVSSLIRDGQLKEGEDPQERLEKHVRKKLEKYRLDCQEKLVERKRSSLLKDYFYGEFQDLWGEIKAQLHQQLAEAGFDDDGIIEYYEQRMTDLLQGSKKGKKFKKGKQALLRLVRDAEAYIQERIEAEQQRERLEEGYEEQSDFADYFPEARELDREILFFCGPTNSGKTHASLNELSKGQSGVYLAPLRLLALEGQEALLERGIEASFLTGEERDMREGATFVSSTIEMLDYEEPVDVAVIDEIQMLGESQRGWAWTNALVGVPAKKIVLTGSSNAIPIVQKIADYLGESFQVRRFSRFNELEVLDEVSSLDDLRPGTAIVCFSRRDVLSLKQEIESSTDFRVSVIYGGLSPEVRREEARRFRAKQSDVLVATDAISMGLNLPIRTVLFWKTAKSYGGKTFPLADTDIKQIAGRAGRYGIEKRGYVGAFTKRSLHRIREAMSSELPALTGPCSVRPLLFHIEMIAELLNTDDLVSILEYFQEEIWFSEDVFKPAVTGEMIELAERLREPMEYATLAEKYAFVCAPVDLKAYAVVRAHVDLALAYTSGHEARLPSWLIRGMTKGYARSPNELRKAETHVKIVTLYRWLSYRFSESFLQVEKAEAYKEILNDYISRSLLEGGLVRRCKVCSERLPFDFRFAVCESCHRQKRPW